MKMAKHIVNLPFTLDFLIQLGETDASGEKSKVLMATQGIGETPLFQKEELRGDRS